MDQVMFDESLFAPNAAISPIESRSKLPLQELPPLSVVFPNADRNTFWTVGVDGVMDPMPPDSGLEVRNVSQSGELPNGVRALVPAGYKEFVKVGLDGWKRIRQAGEGVNAITGERVEAPGGFGEFLEVLHPLHFPGGGPIQTPLPDVNLWIPLSLATDGVFTSSDTPAFGDNVALPNGKLRIVVQVNVSTDPGEDTMTCTGAQFNLRNGAHPITLGQLATQAAKVVTALMVQTRGERSILCVNNMEIDSDDLLLVKLEHVCKGSLRAEIAVRNFGF